MALILGSDLEVDADETTCAAAVSTTAVSCSSTTSRRATFRPRRDDVRGFGFVKCKAFCTSMGSEVVTADELYNKDR